MIVSLLVTFAIIALTVWAVLTMDPLIPAALLVGMVAGWKARAAFP